MNAVEIEQAISELAQAPYDRARGCIVIVRPDQHVASILPLTAHVTLAAFFDEFML